MFANPDELRKYWRARQIRRRAKLVALGLCDRCGKVPPNEGRKSCAACISLIVGARRKDVGPTPEPDEL
jgi:hypothetical protein